MPLKPIQILSCLCTEGDYWAARLNIILVRVPEHSNAGFLETSLCVWQLGSCCRTTFPQPAYFTTALDNADSVGQVTSGVRFTPDMIQAVQANYSIRFYVVSNNFWGSFITKINLRCHAWLVSLSRRNASDLWVLICTDFLLLLLWGIMWGNLNENGSFVPFWTRL